MSPQHNNKPPVGAAQLAHELANLLDGSLRHLGLAIDTLAQTRAADVAPDTTGPDKANVLSRLQTTDRAMRQMAALIHAWMKSVPQPDEIFDQQLSLAETLEQVTDIHRPTADRQGIELTLRIDPDAAELPAATIFPVITNAVLNSIQAFTGSTRKPGSAAPCINVAAQLEDGDVCLTVTDNGPGMPDAMFDQQGQLNIGKTTKPNGHGLGLTLSRQIAHSLRGSLELTNPLTGGACFTLRYPLATPGISKDTNDEAPPRNPTPTLFE